MTGSRNSMGALAVLVTLTPALAQDAATSPDMALTEILIAHDVVYDGIGWERHAANGRLVLRLEEGPFASTSLGEWRVEGEARCLRWTRAMDWECYAVTLDGAGGIAFTDAFGNVSAGRLVAREARGAE